ncbi:nicotinate phosphoribosyltransferase [Candidatus Nomurabacteria bacterium]|nr:nicotinate phosphoribosyltransferase [Candidatus Kaiserbacteria bacterium]MCB9814625.1 nicotinate phosphoribosyltransferase [Candidatus Nomurabacteria bacterium]
MTAKSLLWEKDAPIIRSLVETDVYKLKMLYYIWIYYPYLRVKWAFTNRKVQIPLAKYVSVGALKEQLQAVMELRFSDDDIKYLMKRNEFSVKFLEELKKLRLSMPVVRECNGQLVIEVEGTWLETTLWEIYILAIVAELYGRGRAREMGIDEKSIYDASMQRLEEKIEFLTLHPELKINLYGLRRRLSGLFEDLMIQAMTQRTNCIISVSNMYLARKNNVQSDGTNAHELPMAESAIARHISPEAVRQSPYEVLRKWEKLYGYSSLKMLSDTYGTEAFLSQLPQEIAVRWAGHRQDSGDPFVIGEMIIADYIRRGIDPSDKIIIFADGLDCQLMLRLYDRFASRINVGFGVGTNFSNDHGFFEALSIVVKLIEAAGNPTVKLSDNLAKGMGPEAEQQVIKSIFGYNGDFYQATRY